jgi:hypothetical protein
MMHPVKYVVNAMAIEAEELRSKYSVLKPFIKAIGTPIKAPIAPPITKPAKLELLTIAIALL